MTHPMPYDPDDTGAPMTPTPPTPGHLARPGLWEALRDGPPRTVAELVRATGIEDAIVCRLLIRLVETDRATVVGSPARWTLTAQERRRVRGG